MEKILTPKEVVAWINGSGGQSGDVFVFKFRMHPLNSWRNETVFISSIGKDTCKVFSFEEPGEFVDIIDWKWDAEMKCETVPTGLYKYESEPTFFNGKKVCTMELVEIDYDQRARELDYEARHPYSENPYGGERL